MQRSWSRPPTSARRGPGRKSRRRRSMTAHGTRIPWPDTACAMPTRRPAASRCRRAPRRHGAGGVRPRNPRAVGGHRAPPARLAARAAAGGRGGARPGTLHRTPARLRAQALSGLPAPGRAARRRGAADASARHAGDGRMSATAESSRGRGRALPRWVMALAALGMVVLLVAPVAIVLLTRGARELPVDRIRTGRTPTDVAVQGSTVWVVSGRENRVVSLDARDLKAPPATHDAGSAPLRLAIGAGSVWTANAGDDTVTRLDPVLPGSGRRIPVGGEAVDVAVSPE